MNICLAEEDDALDIAKIHKQEIRKGFLSAFPTAFLGKLYSAIIENDFCVVARNNDEIIGFMAGTANIKKFYSYFLRKYFLYSFFILLPELFNFTVIKKIIEDLFYPRKEKGLPEAEILPAAVKSEFQGRGIAPQMIKLLITEMKNRGVKIFKVVVGEELVPATKLYEKNGFKFLKNISVHGKEESRIYIYEIL